MCLLLLSRLVHFLDCSTLCGSCPKPSSASITVVTMRCFPYARESAAHATMMQSGQQTVQKVGPMVFNKRGLTDWRSQYVSGKEEAVALCIVER